MMSSLPVAYLRVALTAGLCALAAWSFRNAFDDGAGRPLLLAILAPVAVVACLGFLAIPLRRRALGGGAMALAVIAVAIAVAVVTRPGTDVRLGPSRLLTGALPVNPSGPELATVSAVAGFTALLAVALTVSSRSPWLPLLPPVCCLLPGLGLSAAVGALPAWYAPAFTATGLAVVLAGRHSAGGLGKGRLAIGGAVMAAAAVIGLALGPLVAAGPSPASLQALVDAPVTPKEDTNPMARYLALRDNLVPLELTGTASQQADRISMVTLDHFDGQNWTIRADYRRAGTQLPTMPKAPVPHRDITLDLTVLTPGSVGWLPRAGQPTRVSVSGLGFDRASGDIVIPAGRETPTTYRITGSEPVIEAEDVRSDDPAITTPANLAIPPEVLTFIDTATAGRTTGLGQFLGLYQAMTSTGGFTYDTSPEARGGHGLRQIADLVKTKRGTSEQYASAFAALGRKLGWDTRVVLGFRPVSDGERIRIRGQDVLAWVEVRFQRLGWVPVDPSPTQTIGAQGTPSAPRQKPPDTLNDVQPPEQQTPQEPDGTAAPVDTAAPAHDSPVRIATVTAIAATVLILYIGLVPLTKTARRRRARRRGTSRHRAVAAWRDTVESLRGAGIAANRRLTTGQVVRLAGGSLSSFVQPLADVVDRAAYAPEGIHHDGAELAWQCSDAIRTELRSGMSPSAKLRAALDPRPLLPHRSLKSGPD